MKVLPSRLVIGLLAFALSALCVAQDGPQKLAAIRLNAGIHNIRAELAQTPDERATQCFWMKNTLLPLSVAFVADDGTVVNIDDMKPQTTDSHCSAKPVRFVLEMNQGWFAKRGIKTGAKLQGAPFGH